MSGIEGVPCLRDRHLTRFWTPEQHAAFDVEPELDLPGRWFPEPVATALVAVAEAARELARWTAADGREERTNRVIRVRNAVEAMDALAEVRAGV